MHQACEHNLIPLLRLLRVPLSYSSPSTPFDAVHLIFFRNDFGEAALRF